MVADALQVDVDQACRVGAGDDVLDVSGPLGAQLRGRLAQQQPVIVPGPVPQLEPHDDRPVGQLPGIDQLSGRPQDVGRILVVRLDLQPAGTPLAHRLAHRLEILALFGQPVGPAAPGGDALALDDPVPLQGAEPLGQQRGRDSGRALPDLGEGPASVEQVPDDDRRPSLREQLRGARDRAELAVGPHASSVARIARKATSFFDIAAGPHFRDGVSQAGRPHGDGPGRPQGG